MTWRAYSIRTSGKGLPPACHGGSNGGSLIVSLSFVKKRSNTMSTALLILRVTGILSFTCACDSTVPNSDSGESSDVQKLCWLQTKVFKWQVFFYLLSQLELKIYLSTSRVPHLNSTPEKTLSWSPRESASKVTLYGNRHQTQRISPETNRSKPTLTSHFLLHAWIMHAVWAGLHASSSRFILNVQSQSFIGISRSQNQFKCLFSHLSLILFTCSFQWLRI